MLYVPTLQYGLPGKGFQGEMLYAGDNPPYGAVFTYQLKDGLKTLKQKRIDAEKAAEKAGQPIRYPSADELRAEADEEPPAILLTVSNATGTPARVITGPIEKGIQRVAWDLRARRISCRQTVRAVSWRSSSAIRRLARISCLAATASHSRSVWAAS